MPPPIFNLSFNKCATTTVHRFLQANGVASRSHGGNNIKTNLACAFYRNFATSSDPLVGLKRYQAFSDLIYARDDIVLEANALFRYFHRYYPDAYFLFVHRNVEAWISSRMRHGRGDLATRYMAYFGIEDDAALHALWRSQYTQLHQAIQDHFAMQPGRFLLFDLQTDTPEHLCAFLKEDYSLDPTLWRAENVKPRSSEDPSTYASDPARTS